jgi:capsular polysaccharide biosynthesis protein
MNDETREISLQELFAILRRRWLLILAAAVLCAAVLFGYFRFFAADTYTAKATMYVYNDESRSGTTTASELTTSRSLVNTYIVIIESDMVMDEVAKATGVSSGAALRKMISISAVNSTEAFSITVKSGSPELSQLIANTIADTCPSEILRVVKAGAVEVIDYAKLPKADSKGLTTKAAIGFLGGAVVCYGVFLVLELFNTTVRKEEDLGMFSDIPVLGSVPRLVSVKSTLREAREGEAVTAAAEASGSFSSSERL